MTPTDHSARSTAPGSRPSRERWLSRNVFSMGLTSFLSDTGRARECDASSNEMATSLLPTLLGAIGAGPAALGIVDGVSDVAASGVKLLSGWYTGCWSRRASPSRSSAR